MNFDESTGGGVSFERQVTAQVPLGYESVSGDRLAPGIETPGGRSTGEAKSRSPGVQAAGLPVSSSRRIPDRMVRKRRIYLKACLDELERVRNDDDDPVLKSNALADAKGHLQALWELVEGNPSSEAFEEMINVLQVALCAESPEALAPAQLDTIWSVLVKMQDDPDVDDQTANDLTQELIEGGVDVFREIE
jgi:hypothetical protein